MSSRLLFATGPAVSKIVCETLQARIHQFDRGDARDALTPTLSPLSRLSWLDVYLTKPVPTGAALCHQMLIPILMATWCGAFGGNEHRCSVLHVGARFPVDFIHDHLTPDCLASCPKLACTAINARAVPNSLVN
jgi:hypothetical protein